MLLGTVPVVLIYLLSVAETFQHSIWQICIGTGIVYHVFYLGCIIQAKFYSPFC